MEKPTQADPFGKIMPLIGLLTIMWFIISLFCIETYFDNVDEIKKRYKVVIFTVLCGPAVWIIMTGLGVTRLLLEFLKWLKT